MITIPVKLTCDSCNKQADGTATVKDPTGGLSMFGAGGMRLDTKAPAGWTYAGDILTVSGKLACSTGCVTALNDKAKKEYEERRAKEKAKEEYDAMKCTGCQHTRKTHKENRCYKPPLWSISNEPECLCGEFREAERNKTSGATNEQ